MSRQDPLPKRTVSERGFVLPRPGQLRKRVLPDGDAYLFMVLAVGERQCVVLAEERHGWNTSTLAAETIIRCTTDRLDKGDHDRFRSEVPWWHYWPTTLSVQMALTEWIAVEQHQQTQVSS